MITKTIKCILIIYRMNDDNIMPDFTFVKPFKQRHSGKMRDDIIEGKQFKYIKQAQDLDNFVVAGGETALFKFQKEKNLMQYFGDLPEYYLNHGEEYRHKYPHHTKEEEIISRWQTEAGTANEFNALMRSETKNKNVEEIILNDEIYDDNFKKDLAYLAGLSELNDADEIKELKEKLDLKVKKRQKKLKARPNMKIKNTVIERAFTDGVEESKNGADRRDLIEELSLEQIRELSQEEINELTPEEINEFTPKQINEIRKQLTAEQIDELTAEQIKEIKKQERQEKRAQDKDYLRTEKLSYGRVAKEKKKTEMEEKLITDAFKTVQKAREAKRDKPIDPLKKYTAAIKSYSDPKSHPQAYKKFLEDIDDAKPQTRSGVKADTRRQSKEAHF